MREPLEVKWIDCGDYWELQIVHQEFREAVFHWPEKGIPSESYEPNRPTGIALFSRACIYFNGDVLFVRGYRRECDDEAVQIHKGYGTVAVIENVIREYNNANRWRMEGAQSAVSSQSTLDPNWEQKILAKRDAMLRDCFS
jgi:hypothetical protein